MRAATLALLIGLAVPASAAPAAPVSAPAAGAAPARPAEVPNVTIEIYRIAPGQHEAFLEEIARYDEANRVAGLPPRQLYVHSEGADWDFILIQPAKTPPDKVAAIDKAWKDMKLPSGADFFLHYRRFIAEHTDTVASGPTTAADFLATRSTK